MKVGRKLTYDSSKLDLIVSCVKKCRASLGQVADMSEIPRDNFYYWLKRGDEDRLAGLETELAQFSNRVNKERATVIIEMVEMAIKCPKKTKFVTWWLSKICREDFGMEGMEIKELREIFKVILPLIGKGDALNGDLEVKDTK